MLQEWQEAILPYLKHLQLQWGWLFMSCLHCSVTHFATCTCTFVTRLHHPGHPPPPELTCIFCVIGTCVLLEAQFTHALCLLLLQSRHASVVSCLKHLQQQQLQLQQQSWFSISCIHCRVCHLPLHPVLTHNA